MKEIPHPDLDRIGGGLSETDTLTPCPVPSHDDHVDYPRNPMSPCELHSPDAPIINLSLTKEIQ